MFEGHIERIIEEVRPGTSGEDFFNALKTQGEEAQFYVELILAVSEYPAFVEMMKEYLAKGEEEMNK